MQNVSRRASTSTHSASNVVHINEGQICTRFCPSVFPFAGALAASNIAFPLLCHGHSIHKYHTHSQLVVLLVVVARLPRTFTSALVVVFNNIFFSIVGSFCHNCAFLNNRTKGCTSTEQVAILCLVASLTIVLQIFVTDSLTGRKSGGENGGGPGRQREVEPYSSETSCYEGSRPPRLGPAAGSGVQGQTEPWWAQLHQKQNVTLTVSETTN